jgi:PAS domain-containing protein
MSLQRIEIQEQSFISSAVMALSAVIVCALLTVVTPLHANHSIFATLFIPAVLASAWYGGRTWGLIATAFSTAFLIYLALEPVHSFKIDAAEDIARTVAFVFVGTCISLGVAFQRRIHDSSLENAERLRTTLESIADAVTVTDINGNITMMNAIAERLTGWRASDVIGKPLRAVFHFQASADCRRRHRRSQRAGCRCCAVSSMRDSPESIPSP